MARQPGTLLALSTVTLAGALLLVVPLWKSSRRLAMTMTSIALVAFGALRGARGRPVRSRAHAFHRNERRIWREEGVQTSVAIHERRTGPRIQDRMRIMYLDGMHQSNDMRSTVFGHSRIGFLPTALHPNPTRALVVGWAPGPRLARSPKFPGVDVDIVELSGTVVRGAHYFRIANQGVLTRPNVHLRVDDGRNFLLLSPAGALRHHHGGRDPASARRRGQRLLGGVLRTRETGAERRWDRPAVEWRDTASEYALILRTFRQVFPDMTLWGDGSLMLGMKHPLTVDLDAYRRKLEDPVIRKVLEGYNLGSEDKLLRQFVAAPDDISKLVGDGPVTTDDHPLVEYFLSRPQGEEPMDLSTTYGDVRPFIKSSRPVTFRQTGK